MSNQFENPPPPINYGAPNQPFVPDLVIGIILIIFSACGIIAGLFLGGMSAVVATNSAEIASGGGITAGDARTAGGIMGLLSIFVVVICVLQIIVAVGIIKGARWAFIAAIVLNAISVITSLINFQTQNILSIVISAAMIIYCSMRLTGNLGPKSA